MPAVGWWKFFTRAAPAFAPQPGNARQLQDAIDAEPHLRCPHDLLTGGTNVPSRGNGELPAHERPHVYRTRGRVAPTERHPPLPPHWNAAAGLSAGDRGFIRLPDEAGVRGDSARSPAVANPARRYYPARSRREPCIEARDRHRSRRRNRGWHHACHRPLSPATRPESPDLERGSGINISIRSTSGTPPNSRASSRIGRRCGVSCARATEIVCGWRGKRGGDWSSYRQDLWRFRGDRAAEIRDPRSQRQRWSFHSRLVASSTWTRFCVGRLQPLVVVELKPLE